MLTLHQSPLHLHLATKWRKLDGVRHQVQENLLQSLLIKPYKVFIIIILLNLIIIIETFEIYYKLHPQLIRLEFHDVQNLLNG